MADLQAAAQAVQDNRYQYYVVSLEGTTAGDVVEFDHHFKKQAEKDRDFANELKTGDRTPLVRSLDGTKAIIELAIGESFPLALVKSQGPWTLEQMHDHIKTSKDF